jgi:uncharacterized protein DUF4412
MRTAFLLTSLAVAATPLAAQTFEGAVTYRVTSSQGGPADMTVSLKGTKVRMDVSARGQQMYMLLGAGSSTLTTVMPAQKMYMTIDPKMMQMQMGDSNAPKHAPPAKITATGRKETVAGKECEVYLVGEAQDMEVCAAHGMGMWRTPQSPMGGGRGALGTLGSLGDADTNPEYAKLAANGFWPLKVTSKEGGEAKVIMEATQIDAKKLEASVFEVPAGFTEMKMGQGMGRPQ